MLDGADMVQHVAALHHFSGRKSGVGSNSVAALLDRHGRTCSKTGRQRTNRRAAF